VDLYGPGNAGTDKVKDGAGTHQGSLRIPREGAKGLDAANSKLLEKYGSKHSALLALLGNWYLEQVVRQPVISAESALAKLTVILPEIITKAKPLEQVSDVSAEELASLYQAILPAYLEEYRRIEPYSIAESSAIEAAVNKFQPVAKLEEFSGLRSKGPVKPVFWIMESRIFGATGDEEKEFVYMTGQHPTVFDPNTPLKSIPLGTIAHEFSHKLFQEYILQDASHGPHPSGKAYKNTFLTTALITENDKSFRLEMRKNNAESYLKVPGLAYEECVVEAFAVTS